MVSNLGGLFGDMTITSTPSDYFLPSLNDIAKNLPIIFMLISPTNNQDHLPILKRSKKRYRNSNNNSIETPVTFDKTYFYKSSKHTQFYRCRDVHVLCTFHYTLLNVSISDYTSYVCFIYAHVAPQKSVKQQLVFFSIIQLTNFSRAS